MAVGLTYVQQHNAEAEEERRRMAERAERVIAESGDVNELWDAVVREGMEHLIDGVLEQRDIDMLVRNALANEGWQHVNRFLTNVPDRCNDKIMRLDEVSRLVPWDFDELADTLREGVLDM